MLNTVPVHHWIILRCIGTGTASVGIEITGITRDLRGQIGTEKWTKMNLMRGGNERED